MDKKKPLCKFKEKCPDWLAKKNCGFDHVLCKFNDSCKDKEKCMFYHMAKPSFDKPKSETVCKFDGVCKKPNCPFKHQKVAEQSSPNVSPDQKDKVESNSRPPMGNQDKICRFDPGCFRQNCHFMHPQRDAKNSSGNPVSNQPKREQNQIKFEIENNFGGNQSGSRNFENNLCLNFILGNICENGEKCSRPHEFTEKASVKRIFFSNSIPQNNFNVVFYEHQKQGDPQNKELIYVFQEQDALSFRKLISSQNLYKDYGGIGSNQTNKTYLRSVTNQLFKAENAINGIEVFNYNQNEYLVYFSGMMVEIYNTTKGEIDSFSTPRQNNRITGCVLLPEKGILLIATAQIGIKKFQFNASRQKFQERPFNELTIGLKTLKITDSEIFGQKIISGITTSNQLVLMNTDLKIMTVPFGNGAILSDLEIFLANNKVPVALTTVSYGSRQHQVLAINLLNMEREVIMSYEFSSGLDKIFVIENHLMVEVKNKGLLVYKMNEFEKQIGAIPFLNQIEVVRKDNKGNLLILEKTSASSKGSISIFKIKRI